VGEAGRFAALIVVRRGGALRRKADRCEIGSPHGQIVPPATVTARPIADGAIGHGNDPQPAM
jgi:hypothetical protein